MIHYFEVLLVLCAVVFFPVYIYWAWELVEWVKKLFS
jgi:hypothetical protein